MPFLSENSEENGQGQMRKTEVTQITNRYNWGMQNSISESPRCPTLKMGHSGRSPHWCPSCQLRTGARGYNSHRHPTIGQQKIGKTFPGLMSRSDGQSRIWCKRHGGMDPSYLVSMPQVAADGVMGGPFLAHFGPLSTNWRPLKRCSPPESYCWPHCNHLASSSRTMHRVTKLRSAQLLSGTWQWVHWMKWRVVLSPGTDRWAQRYRIPVKNGLLNGGPSNKWIKENKLPKWLQENQRHSMKMIWTKPKLKVYKQHNRLRSFVRVLAKDTINLETVEQIWTLTVNL